MSGVHHRADGGVVTGGWVKSSYSSEEGGQCVEVAHTSTILIRDSKLCDSPMLSIPAAAWSDLLSRLPRH
ncbi:DUF397 domain-containing protein [Yinghuangia seranimata]|nr:DUF397 domain-containing protein [Yinghuangia seranimata]MDI2128212.1 DUF397 domain-containing protein [Yinghuangia seranimata]